MIPDSFGRQWAATYDTPGNPDPGPAVEFLAGLAAGGPVLELAIGTGRVALPLASRGIAVEGSRLQRRSLPCCGPNRVATRSRSSSGIWPRWARRVRTRWSTWFSTRCST